MEQRTTRLLDRSQDPPRPGGRLHGERPRNQGKRNAPQSGHTLWELRRAHTLPERRKCWRQRSRNGRRNRLSCLPPVRHPPDRPYHSSARLAAADPTQQECPANAYRSCGTFRWLLRVSSRSQPPIVRWPSSPRDPTPPLESEDPEVTALGKEVSSDRLPSPSPY